RQGSVPYAGQRLGVSDIRVEGGSGALEGEAISTGVGGHACRSHPGSSQPGQIEREVGAQVSLGSRLRVFGGDRRIWKGAGRDELGAGERGISPSYRDAGAAGDGGINGLLPGDALLGVYGVDGDNGKNRGNQQAHGWK